MFARFRQSRHRLQVSIVETRRSGGKVQHEHVASLGSIETPPSIADRIAFWRRVNERLIKLSNRIAPAIQGKIRGDIHSRISMVMPDEQRTLQLTNAEADERFWSNLHAMNEEQVDGHKALIAKAESAVAKGKAGAADAAAEATVAKERIERIKKGEDVQGGLGKPIDTVATLFAAGFTKKDLRDCVDIYELHQMLGEDGWSELMTMILDEQERARRALVRRIFRKGT